MSSGSHHPPSPANRLWLDVPYDEKEAAKAAGARWDPTHRRWYAPRPTSQLERWAARELPELLPGEDRAAGGAGLFVDLVPASCWFTNVRSCLSKRDWEVVRTMIYRRAGQRCETCGAGRDPDAQVWLEAHERWSYDPATSTQKLVRLICLCTLCHQATHFGLAEIRGQRESALTQLIAVNGWSPAQAERHVDEAFALWRRRSATDWHLDLAMLSDAGLTPTPPPAAAARRQVAAATLAPRSADPATAHTAPPQSHPQAGWYVDPAGIFAHRWWAGAHWTRWVTVDGQPVIDNRTPITGVTSS